MIRQKTCKHCRTKFKPKYSSLERYCLQTEDCRSAAYLEAKKKVENKRRSEWKKEKKRIKEKLKSRSDWEKDVQFWFNQFIRLRDKNDPCISCGRFHEGQYHAGHYRTVGSCPSLRFDEDNCHKQCAPCNNHLSGNLIPYRKNLILKIGIEKVEDLEKEQPPKKYSIPELQELCEHYKQKVRELKRAKE